MLSTFYEFSKKGTSCKCADTKEICVLLPFPSDIFCVSIFPKLIQTEITLNKSSKNNKKKKTKTVNIFKRQSVCIYILLRLSNMDFEERNLENSWPLLN